MNHLKVFSVLLVASWCIIGLAKGSAVEKVLIEQSAVEKLNQEILEAIALIKELEVRIDKLGVKIESCNNRNGFFPVANNPTQFYSCSNNIRYNFSCGNGTIYNDTLAVCETSDTEVQ